MSEGQRDSTSEEPCWDPRGTVLRPAVPRKGSTWARQEGSARHTPAPDSSPAAPAPAPLKPAQRRPGATGPARGWPSPGQREGRAGEALSCARSQQQTRHVSPPDTDTPTTTPETSAATLPPSPLHARKPRHRGHAARSGPHGSEGRAVPTSCPLRTPGQQAGEPSRWDPLHRRRHQGRPPACAQTPPAQASRPGAGTRPTLSSTRQPQEPPAPTAGPQAVGPGSTRKVTNPSLRPWHSSADRASVWQETWRHLGRQHPGRTSSSQNPPPRGAPSPAESSASRVFVAFCPHARHIKSIKISYKGSEETKTPPMNTRSRGGWERPRGWAALGGVFPGGSFRANSLGSCGSPTPRLRPSSSRGASGV